MDDRLDAYRLLIADVYELAGGSRRSSEQLAAQSGQTAARWHVLSVLSGGSMTVPAVARRLGLSRQAVQRVVDDLADAGLAKLEPNPAHARSPLATLTAEGRPLLRDLFRQSEESRAALLERAGVSTQELQDARRVIRALCDAFN